MRQYIEIGDSVLADEFGHVDPRITHQDIHRFSGGEFNIRSGKSVGSQHRILINSNEGRITRWTDNLVRNRRQMSEFRLRQDILGHMHIHLHLRTEHKLTCFFKSGLDYTLFRIGLIRPSFVTCWHLISEHYSCPISAH